MNRKYELVYVVSPEASDEQVTDLHTQIEQIALMKGCGRADDVSPEADQRGFLDSE